MGGKCDEMIPPCLRKQAKSSRQRRSKQSLSKRTVLRASDFCANIQGFPTKQHCLFETE